MATIAIDMDDVLNNLMPTWLQAYNRDYEDNCRPADITDWDVWKHVKPECGKKIYDYHTPELFLACSPMPGAQQATQELIADGHHLMVVSACWHPENEAAKRQWLGEHFPWLKQDRCHFKGWPSGTTGLVFDQPWNQFNGDSYDIPVLRVFNWPHIRDLFDHYDAACPSGLWSGELR